MLTPYFNMLQQWNRTNGRVDRRTYWAAQLSSLIVLTVLLWFAEKIPALGVLPAVYAVVMIVPVFTMTLRRLHDVDRTWRTLLWLFLPVAGIFGVFIFLVQDTVEEPVPRKQKTLMGPRIGHF